MSGQFGSRLLFVAISILAIVFATFSFLYRNLDEMHGVVRIICVIGIPVAPVSTITLGILLALRQPTWTRFESILIGGVLGMSVGTMVAIYCFLILGIIESQYQ